jgi:hypothetical protein
MKKMLTDIGRFNLPLTEILEWVAILSVAFIVILRVYATFNTQPILSYDDQHYRSISTYWEHRVTAKQALKEFFLPNPVHIGNRTAGYNSCLVLGRKFLWFLEPERIFQIVNLILYLIQAAFIFYIAARRKREWWFAFSAVFLYLSMPLIFGLSRWVMTENFVFPAILAFGSMSVWLISDNYVKEKTKRSTSIRTEILCPAVAGYVIGVFGSSREYVLPYLVGVVAFTILILLIQKRWLAVLVFVAVLTPFSVAIKESVSPILRELVAKSGFDKTYVDPNLARYRISFPIWIRKIIFEAVGLAVTILSVTIFCGWIGRGVKSVKKLWLKQKVEIFRDQNGTVLWDRFFFLFSVIMFLMYGGANVLSKFKDIRGAATVITVMFVVLICGLKLINLERKDIVKLKVLLLGAIFLSWGMLTYQAFFAFDGGKTYAVTPKGPPTYNYPLQIRKLTGGNDWHVVE